MQMGESSGIRERFYSWMVGLMNALLYARAALRNFESYGGRAKDMEDRTKGLIAEIEEAMK